jgi:crotonobetainyl-CoA:carnitine CoA-transferase CaiB-like acyl-CoA transferase
MVAAIFATNSRDHWTRLLAPADCCAEPVLSLEEAAASPLVAERGLLEQDAQGRRHLACPLRLSASPNAPLPPAPDLGQHSQEVLSGLGLDAGQIQELRAAGVIA